MPARLIPPATLSSTIVRRKRPRVQTTDTQPTSSNHPKPGEVGAPPRLNALERLRAAAAADMAKQSAVAAAMSSQHHGSMAVTLSSHGVTISIPALLVGSCLPVAIRLLRR